MAMLLDFDIKAPGEEGSDDNNGSLGLGNFGRRPGNSSHNSNSLHRPLLNCSPQPPRCPTSMMHPTNSLIFNLEPCCNFNVNIHNRPSLRLTYARRQATLLSFRQPISPTGHPAKIPPIEACLVHLESTLDPRPRTIASSTPRRPVLSTPELEASSADHLHVSAGEIHGAHPSRPSGRRKALYQPRCRGHHARRPRPRGSSSHFPLRRW